MKKIASIATLIILVLLLSGCQLAKENTIYSENSDENNRIPYAVVFDLYSAEETYIEEISNINIEEYFYFSYICEGEEYNEDTTCVNLGKSISGDLNIKQHEYTLNGEHDRSTITYALDGYMYVSNEMKGSMICISTKYTEDPDSKLNGGFCTDFYGGAILSVYSSGINNLGQEVYIDFQVELVAVDELNNIIINEYNDDDELLKTTVINKTFEVYEFITDIETSYIILNENYIDEEGIAYSERTLINRDLYSEFFGMKFTDQFGFIVDIPLSISFE